MLSNFSSNVGKVPWCARLICPTLSNLFLYYRPSIISFVWTGEFILLLYSFFSFGCRSSPKIFDQFSQAICRIAQNNNKIKSILHFLDNFLTIDKPDFHADRTMALLTMIFMKLNVPIAQHKTTGPGTVVEYLGIILDSQNMQVRLPPDKVHRIWEMLQTFCANQSCTYRELLQLLEHLNFAFRVIVPVSLDVQN